MILLQKLEYNFCPTYIEMDVSYSFGCLHIRDTFLDGILFMYWYIVSWDAAQDAWPSYSP